MAEKVEFAGPGWMAAIKEKLERLAARDASITLSICEVFTGSPRHLAESGTIAWHCRIADGRVMFADGVADDVDIKNIADYQAILPFARLQITEASRPEYERMAGEAMAAGKLQRIGDMTKIPPSLHGLHNEMAVITA
jgi:hypothetical protein